MKLVENEERALKELREELFAKYPIVDIRLYGSKARGAEREDAIELWADEGHDLLLRHRFGQEERKPRVIWLNRINGASGQWPDSLLRIRP